MLIGYFKCMGFIDFDTEEVDLRIFGVFISDVDMVVERKFFYSGDLCFRFKYIFGCLFA